MAFFRRRTESARHDNAVLQRHWHVFVVRCNDGSLFTGVSEDVEQAVGALNGGEGSPYVRSRTPVTLAYTEEYMNRQDAERRAETIRRMSRQGKEGLLGYAPSAAVMPEFATAA
jgi:putative endonuclease